MCLAIPMKIVKIIDKDEGIVSSGRVKKRVNLGMVSCNVGDYVIIHAGFAIQKVNQREAKETLEVFKELK